MGSIVALKVATLEGTLDDSCHPQDFCWGWRKAHFVARRKSPSKRKFWETTLTIVAMSESLEVCQFSSTEAISTHCYNVSASN